MPVAPSRRWPGLEVAEAGLGQEAHLGCQADQAPSGRLRRAEDRPLVRPRGKADEPGMRQVHQAVLQGALPHPDQQVQQQAVSWAVPDQVQVFG